MFERLIAFEEDNQYYYYFVPFNISLVEFIENVKNEIAVKQRYNTEIHQIKNKLDKEQSLLESGDSSEITAEDGKILIQTFMSNHPYDKRSVKEILEDAGAIELLTQIPEANVIRIKDS